MNNAPLTLILIAAVGLIVVLSLGVFFAVKPRSKSTRLFYYGIPPGEEGRAQEELTTRPPLRAEGAESYPGLKSLNYNVENGQLRKSPEEYQKLPRILDTLTARIPVEAAAVRQRPTPFAFLVPVTRRRPTTTSTTTAAASFWSHEKRMLYGKVVGLAFSGGRLIAPSHDSGNVSVLSAPELRLVEELVCPKCRIYDVAALPNGDLVVAQGKRAKLSLLSRSEKRLAKEVHLHYATKGVAVSPDGLVYVLTRGHDKIQVYNGALESVGTVFIPNDGQDDCNFLVVDSIGRLIVSCESEVYIMDGKSGEYIDTILAPPDVSYSMGVGVAANDDIFLARRGRARIDVYSKRGEFLRSLGSDAETLWSDIAVGPDFVYVIDYMDAVVKAIPY